MKQLLMSCGNALHRRPASIDWQDGGQGVYVLYVHCHPVRTSFRRDNFGGRPHISLELCVGNGTQKNTANFAARWYVQSPYTATFVTSKILAV